MRHVFLDRIGFLRVGWIIFFAAAAMAAALWPLLYYEAKYKAEMYERVTGQHMTVGEAFFIAPEFIVIPGKGLEVKKEAGE